MSPTATRQTHRREQVLHHRPKSCEHQRIHRLLDDVRLRLSLEKEKLHRPPPARRGSLALLPHPRTRKLQHAVPAKGLDPVHDVFHRSQRSVELCSSRNRPRVGAEEHFELLVQGGKSPQAGPVLHAPFQPLWQRSDGKGRVDLLQRRADRLEVRVESRGGKATAELVLAPAGVDDLAERRGTRRPCLCELINQRVDHLGGEQLELTDVVGQEHEELVEVNFIAVRQILNVERELSEGGNEERSQPEVLLCI
eukprot:766850-Hanusia_phi.AAC.8